jgi:hypothetical protein
MPQIQLNFIEHHWEFCKSIMENNLSSLVLFQEHKPELGLKTFSFKAQCVLDSSIFPASPGLVLKR